jgi:PAS domain-containing protein
LSSRNQPVSAAVLLQVLNFHSMNESQRIVVVDDKLRIVYASDALAKMLGTTSQQMTRLALGCLVTPPCAQLHNRWILVRAL